ncbi:hypothetical protein L6164_017986 [Bauhinia variegata]|uniref:Uncharacterized protein n=1 Tax=Bauhinia variegata TaxID=167791 RepID=A0ACB9N9S2_BAUVA|nr:hypothetical protein L6164_017986 [Bauhinia variegata]
MAVTHFHSHPATSLMDTKHEQRTVNIGTLKSARIASSNITCDPNLRRAASLIWGQLRTLASNNYGTLLDLGEGQEQQLLFAGEVWTATAEDSLWVKDGERGCVEGEDEGQFCLQNVFPWNKLDSIGVKEFKLL